MIKPEVLECIQPSEDAPKIAPSAGPQLDDGRLTLHFQILPGCQAPMMGAHRC